MSSESSTLKGRKEFDVDDESADESEESSDVSGEWKIMEESIEEERERERENRALCSVFLVLIQRGGRRSLGTSSACFVKIFIGWKIGGAEKMSTWVNLVGHGGGEVIWMTSNYILWRKLAL